MKDKNKNRMFKSNDFSKDEFQNGDKYGYKIIAIVYDKNHWCAFRGFVELSEKEVIELKDVISFGVARYLFPTIANVIPEYRC